MSLPQEKRRALLQMKEFVLSLLDPKKTPKVPRAIRREAYYRLKHYPYSYEIEEVMNCHPDIFGKSTKK